MSRPSGVNTGLWLNTSEESFHNRRGCPLETDTVQISPEMPPILLMTANSVPSGDQAMSSKPTYVLSVANSLRKLRPSESAIATARELSASRVINAIRDPSGDQTPIDAFR